MVVHDESLTPFISKSLNSSQYKVFPLAGDASNRRYYRVVLDQQSWVLMQWDPFNPAEYPFLSVLQHFFKNGVQVPEVVAMSPDEGLVLLEDLGDLTLERKFWESQSQESVIDFYQMALDEIIKIHFTATDNKAPCTAFNIKFDTEKFLWEMNYGKEHLIRGILKHHMSDEVFREVQGIFMDICTKLDKEPKRITHRDYHSRNLMIKLGKMRVIDFQDARLGPVQYDLVSLFKDSYVNLSEDSVKSLMEYYLAKSGLQQQRDFSREEFDRIYELQSIQRCFKACGSFASFWQTRQDKRYLKYLTPTLKRVVRSLGAFPEYKTFTDVIFDSGALEKNFEAL